MAADANVSSPKTPRPTAAQSADSRTWMGVAAGGALLAGGLLILFGQRRAGTIAAASGTALALLDQPETLKQWWGAMPETIDRIQDALDGVQNTVADVAGKREALHRFLGR